MSAKQINEGLAKIREAASKSDWFSHIKSDKKKKIASRLFEKFVSKPENARMLFSGTENSQVNEGQLNEAPTTSITGIGQFKKLLIPTMARSTVDNLGVELCGVFPMNAPTMVINTMQRHRGNQSAAEALYDTLDSAYSGTGTHNFAGQSVGDGTDETAYSAVESDFSIGKAIATTVAEEIGESGGPSRAQVSVSSDNLTVTAGSRELEANYSDEAFEDSLAMNDLNIVDELVETLRLELASNINSEILGEFLKVAKMHGTAPFDFAADHTGLALNYHEKSNLLYAEIAKAAGKIYIDTKEVKAKKIVTTQAILDRLMLMSTLHWKGADPSTLAFDVPGNLYAGKLGPFSIYIDTFATKDYILLVGEGMTEQKKAMYYCPYVPLQMKTSVNSESFHDKIMFRTRYGLVGNPFATDALDGALTARTNKYLRLMTVDNA